MADLRFYDRAGPFALARIAETLGAALEPAEAVEWMIEDVASLASARPTDLGFAVGRRVLTELAATQARAVLIDEPTRGVAGDRPAGRAYLVVKDPQRAFAEAAERFYPPPAAVAGIDTAPRVDPTAEVAPTAEIAVGAVIGAGAKIGESVAVGPNTVVGRACVIGRGTRIGPNCTLAFALVGENCLFHPGVRIGQDGFGFVMGVTHRKIPQLGRVVIGDDVEIGANTTVDRGALDDTVIGNGVIIDNLVQIGHNCRVGDGSVIVAQAGIAGGTRLEHHVVMAAQSGAVGHLTIGAGARVGGQAGVMRDVPPGTDVFGTPAEPARGSWRRYTRLRRMADKNDE